MESIAFESFDEDSATFFTATKQLDLLVSLRDRIAVEGICKDDALLINRMDPTILSGVNLNTFTMNRSSTNAGVAAEAIDWRKTGIIAATVAMIAAFIIRIITWLRNSSSTTGKRAGAIKEIAVLNAKLADIERKGIELPVEELEKVKSGVAAQFAKKYERERAVARSYIDKLAEMMDAGKLKDSKDRPLSLHDLTDAVAAYVDTSNKVGNGDPVISGKVLGTMLLAPNGALPAVISRLEWAGGVDYLKVSDIESSIQLLKVAGKILSLYTGFIPAMKAAGAKRVALLKSEDKRIDLGVNITQDGGKHMYEFLLSTRARVDTILKEVTTKSSADTLLTFSDIYLKDSVISTLTPRVKDTIDLIKEENNTWISFWKTADYQSHETKVHPALPRYRNIIGAMSSARGRDELAEFYGAMFDINGKEAKSKLDTESKTITDLLSVAKKESETISKMIASEEFRWAGLLLATHDVANNQLTGAMHVFKEYQQLYQIAQSIVKNTADVNTAGLILCNAASYCVDYMTRLK